MRIAVSPAQSASNVTTFGASVRTGMRRKRRRFSFGSRGRSDLGCCMAMQPNIAPSGLTRHAPRFAVLTLPLFSPHEMPDPAPPS